MNRHHEQIASVLLGALFIVAELTVFEVRAADASQEVFSVGTAKIDITPSYPVRLTGYGNRRKESEGVAQHLWAKAIAIGDDSGTGPAVWITFENCGLTSAIRDQVAGKLHQAAGIKSERLAISVTHSHTAPALTNWAPFLFGADIPAEHQEHIDQYTRELTEKLSQVAIAALADRRPSRLSWGRGTVGFAVNRRVLKDGTWTGFGVQADGPVDHRLPILAVHDLSGKLTACIANYACHCTTLGGNFNRIAGDWAGYAQSAIEADHPGCTAMITIGCGADANPNPRQDDLAVCERQGRELAGEVQRLLKTKLTPVRGPLNCKLTEIELPFESPRTEDQWKELAKSNDVSGYHARQYLARVQRGEKIPTTLTYPIGTWTFGNDLAMVFLGGEVVVDYSIRFHEEFASDRLWINAYTNDVPCYIPSKRILKEGGYEADRSMALYARPNRLSGEIEDFIVDTVQKLLPHSFYAPKKQADFPAPKSPADSLAAIQLPDGWQVELVAAEPLIEDPVAFDWGPDGRLWVAEMLDYPNGIAWSQPGDPIGVPGGRIKVLTDSDQDGKYDRADLFLDRVPFPNGIKVWRNGVLITAAPQIFYAEDTNGDGRADKQEELFTGFVTGNQQHRANGLRWGVDNWLYVANGDSGGKIKAVKTGAELPISGRDLRIRPDENEMESQSGQTQFGRCRDDWNNWFGGNNANPLWHYVLDDHYLRRNPHFSPPAVRRDVPEVPGTAPVFPASKTLARFNDFHTANRFTSACAPEIYRDDLLQKELGENFIHVFICEPVHNLVHHEIMSAQGVSFTSRRPDTERETEFFASSDNWSRPVMARTGPDGAIWIADMYRQVIEHPEWIPATWQRKLDVRAGADQGRIYRVFRKDKQRELPKLDRASTKELAELLEHPNGWVRDTAQQILLWRNETPAVHQLESLLRSSNVPLARLHALCTLDGLRSLQPATLLVALGDRHPGVRRHAVRLSEPFLSQSKELTDKLVELVGDKDPQVQMQVAYSLGEWNSAVAGEALARLALQQPESEYLVAAIFSSVNGSNIESFTAELLSTSSKGIPATLVQRTLAIASGLGDKDGVNRIVREATKRSTSASLSEQFRMTSVLLTALRQSRSSLASILDSESTERFADLSKNARKALADSSVDEELRMNAVRFLSFPVHSEADDATLFASLLSARQPPPLQAEALAALASRFPQRVTDLALAEWRSHSPTLRANILDALLSRVASTKEFLTAVERGAVPTAHIDSRRRQQLTTHLDNTVREKAIHIFGIDSSSGRQQVVEQFKSVIALAGDSTRGKSVFGKRCAVCHKLEGFGQNVGPDLTALTDKSPGSLLNAILDPNKAVEDKFLDYVVVTIDGRQLTGLVTDETSNSVTLTGQEAKQVTLRRNEIDLMQSTGKSLMPEGMEKDLPAQDLADVIAYVRSVTAPPKTFPGNHPELAHVRDDGSIRLLAMNAKIYGPKLVFEDKYRNLGYWQSPEDHAVWMMKVPKKGKYQVRLDYACDDSAAGNRFILTVGDQSVGGVIVGTGSWDHYRGQTVGTIQLAEGYAELVLRSDGPIRSALMDLRQIILEPR